MLKPELTGGVIVYSFEPEGKLNAEIAENVRTELSARFDEPGTLMILDLGNISYVDSLGFSSLLSVMRKARSSSGVFRLCNIKPDVMRIFRLLRLQNVFYICDTRDECLKSFEQSQ
ncbi:MAG: anti-sigma factor antagonist [Marinilabiliales bacterium]|nr:MAG: anti-sigma factor antagonist [Marinilabiliales bacterium]